MNNNDIKKICISVAKADTEEEVVNIFKKADLWDNANLWKYYGNNENNFSTIGNQQSSPDAALVEKIINSVDAVLMSECLKRKINPGSKKAPQNIAEAQKMFFDIHDGKLSSLDAYSRTTLAQNILLVSTGKKGNPCYSIIDLGEGQSPRKMPETFLSLHRSNKLRIPFVQGKFNMGGTGSLLFCGDNNMQLIISRRHPDIAKQEDDETSNKWGFTIVRREAPSSGMRSSTYKYLAPNGKILMFESDSMPLLPGEYPDPYGDKLKHGTFIKLYEYQLTSYRTLIVFDLYNRLSLLLPRIALPMRVLERRKGYTGHTMEATLSGLSVRLDEDKRENLEPGFPSSSEMKAMGQEMKISIFAFKKNSREKYAKNEGVIFIVNGQAHGFLPKAFFERKAVGMAYLSDSIIVTVDCSKIEGRMRENLFMNSRDRLREGDLLDEIEDQIEDIVKNHQGLRELRERRRREDIEDKLQDSKPLVDVLENIIKKSPSLSKIFLQGVRIRNPFKFVMSKSQEKFEGRKFPTYFRLEKKYSKDSPKKCPINRRFRIQFETDAENDYFDRENDPGEFGIKRFKSEIKDYTINLWSGLASLTVALPDGVKEGDLISFKTEVSDISRVEPFANQFYIKVEAAEKKREGKAGERKKPTSTEGGKERKVPSYLDLPNVIEVRKGDWDKYDFKEGSALCVKDSGEEGYDFYINMDNVYLQTEIKGQVKIDPKLLEARYMYGMVLIGISLLDDYEKGQKTQGVSRTREIYDESIYNKIRYFTTAVSPILLPMIASLGDIQVG